MHVEGFLEPPHAEVLAGLPNSVARSRSQSGRVVDEGDPPTLVGVDADDEVVTHVSTRSLDDGDVLVDVEVVDPELDGGETHLANRVEIGRRSPIGLIDPDEA